MASANVADEDDERLAPSQVPERGMFDLAPNIEAVQLVLAYIKLVLKPWRDTGAGYKDLKIDLILCGRLNLMKLFLWHYVDLKDGWIASLLQVAHAAERGPWLARQLRK